MKDGREVITSEDITQFLLKSEKVGFIVWPLFCGFMCLFFLFSTWIEDLLIWDILSIGAGLLCVYCLAMVVVNIKKIKNGTYFTITTDVVIRKAEFIKDRWHDTVDRLYFQYDHYDIYPKNRDVYYELYGMELGAVMDTAFVGDTFTLVKVKKRVVLVFNNKLFNVQY